jgi:Na+/H+ antiporter NhaD/arsenite permease-like protein
MAAFTAIAVFTVSLAGLFLDKWHRVVVSALGASAMVIVGHLFHFYDEHEAVSAIDFETLGLLLGMMIIVSLLRHTGFFEYVAIKAAQASGGSAVRLMLMLGLTTSVLSMFLDNVTTVVFMAPVTVLIAELLMTSPIPLLISQAVFSNTGGMATLVGDPPNILIGTAAGLTFSDFLTRMGLIVLGIWIVTYGAMRFIFRHDLAVASQQQDALGRLKADEALTDPLRARRLLIVLAGVIGLFFLENVLEFAPAFSALFGASLALGWTGQDIHKTLQEVEWDVLLFFSALFVMVGGLGASGLLDQIANALISLQDASPVMLGLIVLWVVVILSALIDNIPVTIAIIPVVLSMGAEGINIQPLWWAVALGAGLGGNATPIGSTANVVVISISERTHSPISARRWLAVGVPTVLAATIAASVLYILFYDFLAGG